MNKPITLNSHALCPYVQRIAIALVEKGVAHERRVVDLGNKPQWFLEISPLGRTPVLTVGDASLFESTAILEYLEDTQPNPLHPADPVERARHRAWIVFGAEVLDTIAGFYSARDAVTFEAKTAALRRHFTLLEDHLSEGPWFSGADFSLVDVAFGPVFRYFDVFNVIDNFEFFEGLTKVQAWSLLLAARPSVRDAVSRDYNALLRAFLLRREGVLAARILISGAA
ncbi:glutathione S-transferase family protein [Roseovarius mucosus]|uniref:glutathione transferase n=1 Tax=Roseovarius mucosus TaxID=215743 RepID=A0A1V0RJT3_9RHOB|nr:glutathione S-transferase family protein [Roseovarius mucosus]ARE81976.1 glutathione S-transferase [Roseovarius mucosus]